MFENKAITAATIPSGEGTALKAIAWPELTARINAARDLRSVLRPDSACMMASFTDAAAGYFASIEDPADQDKRPVNPDALEHGKPAGSTTGDAEGEAAKGDREI